MRRIALLMTMLMALAGCGSGDTTDSPTSTAATTTTATTTSTTTTPGSTEAKVSATFPGSGETAFLESVDVSADASIRFDFEGDVVPAYRAEYVEPPIVADPSGMPIDLDGQDFLQITVSPGSGVDLSGDEPRETFTGEDRFTAESVDGVIELAETSDFEAVLSWTIGLTDRFPFSVDASPGSVTVVLTVTDDTTASLLGSEPTTCSAPTGFTVSYPGDWWASTGELECRFFAPNEIDIESNTDTTAAPVMISTDPVDFQTATAPSESRDEVSRAVTTLDGRRAARVVSTVTEGLYPSGTEITSYFVDLEPGDTARTLIASTIDLDGFDYRSNVALLDEMFRTIELDQPGPRGIVADYRGGGTPFTVTADTAHGETCLTVSPGDDQACLAPPAGNRVEAAVVGDALVGLAGPDVFEVDIEGGVSFLPVETMSGTAAWALPFDGADYTVLGSDGNRISIAVES